MARNGISGIPVVERGDGSKKGKLVGILTNRDVRFATDTRQPVAELMTKDNLVTVREGVGRTRPSGCCTSIASRSCWWSTRPFAASASITVKDIEKAPNIRTPARTRAAACASPPRPTSATTVSRARWR